MTASRRGYSRLIGRLVAHSNISVICALILIGIAGYGLSRVPTGFIPIEDQGYLLVAVQLPDGAALERTQHVLDQVSEIAGKAPGVDQVITIAGISALDNSSSLANAGVAYLILKEWSARGKGEDLRSLFVGLNEKLSVIEEARILVVPPPPIQGIGNAAGFAMQVAAARRQFRFRQAAGDHRRDRRQRADAERAAARQFAVPLDGAAVRHRGRPDQDPDAACHDRPGLLDAVVLHGLDLRQPVQQVRPHLPGLCAGGRAIPPDAA